MIVDGDGAEANWGPTWAGEPRSQQNNRQGRQGIQGFGTADERE